MTCCTLSLTAAKEREKALKLAHKSSSANVPLPKASKKAMPIGIKSVVSSKKQTTDQQEMDITALNLNDDNIREGLMEEIPKVNLAKEKVLEEAQRALDAKNLTEKKGISLVVIGKWFFLTILSD